MDTMNTAVIFPQGHPATVLFVINITSVTSYTNQPDTLKILFGEVSCYSPGISIYLHHS